MKYLSQLFRRKKSELEKIRESIDELSAVVKVIMKDVHEMRIILDDDKAFKDKEREADRSNFAGGI